MFSSPLVILILDLGNLADCTGVSRVSFWRVGKGDWPLDRVRRRSFDSRCNGIERQPRALLALRFGLLRRHMIRCGKT